MKKSALKKRVKELEAENGLLHVERGIIVSDVSRAKHQFLQLFREQQRQFKEGIITLREQNSRTEYRANNAVRRAAQRATDLAISDKNLRQTRQQLRRTRKDLRSAEAAIDFKRQLHAKLFKTTAPAYRVDRIFRDYGKVTPLGLRGEEETPYRSGRITLALRGSDLQEALDVFQNEEGKLVSVQSGYFPS